MAGAFSSHLLERFPDNGNSSIMSDGAMSFDVSMHGTNPFGQRNMPTYSQPFTPFREGPSQISQDSAEKLSRIQAKLNQKLGPEFLSQRPGPGGGAKLTYVEGWKVINLANEVFGFNGWSSSIVRLQTDFIDYSNETKRFNVGVTAIMRVTLRDGISHEDVGFGFLENSRSKAAAIDKCNKEAVTDGLKRALRNFGNILGNCLYDKTYTAEVMRIKPEPTKLKEDELHRRPEFNAFAPIGATTLVDTSLENFNRAAQSTPVRPPALSTPVSAVPNHMRPNAHNNGAAPSHLRPSPIAGQQHTAQAGPSRISTNQQPNHSTSDRKVTFQPQASTSAKPTVPVPIPKPELDEFDAFALSAEDEAMFAAADLGPALNPLETDIGQPIRPDEDLGQPIDHEEGLLAALNELQESEQMNLERIAAQMPPPRLIPPAQQRPMKQLSEARAASKTREEIIAEALMGTSGASSSTNLKPPSPAPQPALPSLPGQHERVQITTRSLVQQNHQRYMIMKEEQAQRHNQADSSVSHSASRDQDQNRNPYTGSQHPQAGSAQRPTSGLNSRPSMGGFNYPPGVTPPSFSGSATASGSGIGTKRPADAMGSSRGNRPGMGLEQATAGTGSIKRTVLGDIGETNDLKRLKR